MARLLLVGEKPSATAYRMRWTWESGRLAAKPLFDALLHAGVAPGACWFLNLFGDAPHMPEAPQIQRLAEIRAARLAGWRVVAMGNKVAAALGEQLTDAKIVHPAARGKIRGRDAYRAHVREALQPILERAA